MIPASVFWDRLAGSRAQPVTFLTFVIVISCVFYYLWLHLRFVRERLRSVSGGDLRIESVPGEGCRVTIELPKEEGNHADLRHR